MDETWDIQQDLNRCNPLPFRVENYVVERRRFLDVERFAAVQVEPEGVATFIDEHGRRKRYHMGVWKDLWVHA